MTPRELGKLGCALLVGAGIAFPAGLMLAGREGEPPSRAAPAPAPASGRAVYSPRVLSDPYFLDQQRKGAEALEAHCRSTGEMCDIARKAREMLAELKTE
jgi:hypothetical protein